MPRRGSNSVLSEFTSLRYSLSTFWLRGISCSYSWTLYNRDSHGYFDIFPSPPQLLRGT